MMLLLLTPQRRLYQGLAGGERSGEAVVVDRWDEDEVLECGEKQA